MNIAKRKGFTLVEIIVVVSIFGLLVSIVLATFTSARAKARDERRKSDIKQLQSAIQNYFNTCYAYPAIATWQAQLDGTGACSGYTPGLTRVPTDPQGIYPYEYYTDAPASGKRFHVCAVLDYSSNNKGRAGLPEFVAGVDRCNGALPRTYDLAGGAI